jgi:hypothetical protein
LLLLPLACKRFKKSHMDGMDADADADADDDDDDGEAIAANATN